jgi:hypothetical protein
MTHHSYCEFHLGDNLAHLHFVRKMALRYPGEHFSHAAHECHLKQLAEVVQDVPNVTLVKHEDRHPEARDVWKNAHGFWERHVLRNDYAGFYLAWFNTLAGEMAARAGRPLESPLRSAADLLFDYPAILESPGVCSWVFLREVQRPELLFVNSQPCSGQFRAYDSLTYLDPLIKDLAERYRTVVTQPTEIRLSDGSRIACTRDWDLSITGVGKLSLLVKYIVMISTGPSWPTMNVWNQETVKFRLVFLDREELGLTRNTVQVNTIEGAYARLRAAGLL